MRETIATLRKKVLTLAVSGQLVQQDPSEGTGEELYQAIQKARAEAAKTATGRKKKAKPLPPITPDEIPFEIPESWRWVRLGDVFTVAPRNYLDDKTEVSFLPMSQVNISYLDLPNSIETKEWIKVKTGYTHIASNDLVIAKITPCFENGKSGVTKNLVNGFGAGTTELHVLRDDSQLVLPEYFLCIIKSDDFINAGRQVMTGAAGQKRVPADFVSNYVVGLPPPAEQRRIVAKVEEIMQTLDLLEQEANDVESVLDLLEKRIFTEAVSGKLVPQDPSEGTGEELYQAIQKSRTEAAKIATGRKKNAKPLPPITPEEIPFDIPQSWKWVRLGDIVRQMSNGMNTAQDKSGNGYMLTRIETISSGVIDLNKVGYTSEQNINDAYRLKEGDILFSHINSDVHLGKTALFDGTAELYHGVNLLLIRTEKGALSGYLHVYFIFARGINAYDGLMKRSNNQVSINQTNLSSLLIALPPLAEQCRIVAKVDEAMSLIKYLREAVK